MLSLYDLIEYFSTGPTLLFFGAGPSCELGLPTWPQLTKKILQIIQKKHLYKRYENDITSALKYNDFPLALSLFTKIIGEDELYQLCETFLEDNGKIGIAYDCLAKLPFCGYITSNFEDIFQRHLELNGKAVTVHTNSKTEIEQVDFDSIPTLVKIHSDFKNTRSIILTKEQYNKVEFHKDFEYLKEFLKSYVLTRRLLIVGYSLSDPDIALILGEATRIIRRRLPIYAILANASNDQIKEWDLKYNVKIFPYHNPDNSHSDLKRILNLLVEYSGISSSYTPKDVNIELKEAQHLYMWHKLHFCNELESIHGAIDSLILGLLYEHGDSGIQIVQIKEKVVSFIPNLQDSDKIITESIDRLANIGFIKRRGHEILLLPPGKSSCEKNIGQFNRLCNIFKQQIILDCQEDLKISKDASQKIANISLNSIIDLFRERAIEIFNNIFKENPSGITPSLGMLKIFNENAAELDALEKKAWIIMKCTQILKAPRHHETELMSYLSRAYFCYQTLQLDPEAYATQAKYLSERLCIIDSNILIPCICDGHPNQSIYKDAFERASKIGIKFYVLDETIDEVIRAANWAKELIRENGSKSTEVLFAASGFGSYRSNQFLEAYIETTGKNDSSFDDFLHGIFSGNLTFENVKKIVAEKWPFIPCSEGEITKFSKSTSFYQDVIKEILNRAEDSIYSKTQKRIETEAKVYTMIAKWKDMKKTDIQQERCCFISMGGFLNSLSKSEKVGIDYSPAMTMDGIIEILRFSEHPEKRMDFQKWIKLNYFPGSIDLLHSKSARQFFEKTIDQAEEAYYDNLKSFQETIDKKLSKNYIEKIDEVERPVFVASLFAKKNEIDRKMSESEEFLKEKLKRAEKENDKLAKRARYWKMMARLKDKKFKS